LVANNKIHYFVDAPRGPMHAKSSGSRQAAEIAAWVTAHFPARTIDGVTVYDLSSPPRNGTP
jgi:hypothetical protein